MINDKPDSGLWRAQTVLVGLMIPSAMIALNRSMINVALPAIRDNFEAGVDRVAWVITIYTLPNVILMPLYGRLGDGLGKRRLLLIGVAIFTLGTCLNLFASNLYLLMLGRAIQGAGAASIMPLAIASISQLFPVNSRGRALGVWNTVGPAIGVVGPLLAGSLIDLVGWRTIFLPILLVGIVSPFIVRRSLPPIPGNAQVGFLHTFDWVGVTLLSATATSLLFYLSSQSITGVTALADWRLLLLTLFLLISFIIWERRSNNPFIFLGVFTQKLFTLASISGALRMFASSGISFVIPLYLADIQKLNALAIGVTLLTHSGAGAITVRLGGQLADRWGSRWLVVFGASVQMGVMAHFALLSGTAPLPLIIMGMVAHGLGVGLAVAALHRVAIGDMPLEQMGMAAGLYSMIRFSGLVFGTALDGVLFQYGLDRGLLPLQAYHFVFWFLVGVALLGIIVGLTLRE